MQWWHDLLLSGNNKHSTIDPVFLGHVRCHQTIMAQEQIQTLMLLYQNELVNLRLFEHQTVSSE